MHQNTLVFFNGILNEVKNGFSGSILVVKYDLILKIKPLKRQVYHSTTFEVVHYLFASAIYDVSNFICHHEFLVLYIREMNEKIV